MIRVDHLQFKRIVTLETLMSMPVVVPDIQRGLDVDVVASIVEYQRSRFKACGSLLFLGDLTAVESGSMLNLVDGQHRFEAMRQIYLLQPDYTITLNIVRLDHTLTLEEVFVLLNKSQPVPAYIIQSTIDKNKRATIDHFRDMFLAEFKPYVSKAASPRKPNVSLVSIVDAIPDSTLTSLVSAERLFEFMRWVNVTVCRPMLDARSQQLCISKAKPDESKALFLCADRDHEWLRSKQLVAGFLNKTCTTTEGSQHYQPQAARSTRARIPKAVRMFVWRREFGDSAAGKCACCLQSIQIDVFEAGHIVSCAHGGSCHESNLKPVCAACNRSMGATNMNQFVKRFFDRELS